MIARAHHARRDRPRVLFAGPLPPPHHGCAVVTRNLLASSLAHRFDLVHLDTADRRGVENIGRLDVGNVWRAGLHGAQFLRLLSSTRPDLVYLMIAQNTWGFLRDALFMSPAALSDVPLVLHFHSGQFDRFVARSTAPMRTLIRSLVSRAQRAVVLGDSLAPTLDGLLPRARISVVPNGVPDLTGAVQRSPGRSTTRLLFLGNLMPGKGYIELITAVDALLRDGVDIDLTLAGEVSDPDAHQQALVSAQRWQERIRFAGPVGAEQKVELLRASDVLVLPSYYENEAHPLVVLEAMAAGMPVVATRYVAIPETVVDGETGLLVPMKDCGALREALRTLAADAPLRTRMGAAARQRYLTHYTVDAWAERLGTVFDDVLAVRAA